tara:strand:+ start:1362 stop:2132 length:771 start_codon:yes stop_codon:yes gene_type:complete
MCFFLALPISTGQTSNNTFFELASNATLPSSDAQSAASTSEREWWEDPFFWMFIVQAVLLLTGCMGRYLYKCVKHSNNDYDGHYGYERGACIGHCFSQCCCGICCLCLPLRIKGWFIERKAPEPGKHHLYEGDDDEEAQKFSQSVLALGRSHRPSSGSQKEISEQASSKDSGSKTSTPDHTIIDMGERPSSGKDSDELELQVVSSTFADGERSFDEAESDISGRTASLHSSYSDGDLSKAGTASFRQSETDEDDLL